VELAFDVVGKIGRIELVPVVVELVELEQVLEQVLERVLEWVLVVVVDNFELVQVQAVVELVERVLVVGSQLVVLVLVPVEIVEQQVALVQVLVVGRLVPVVDRVELGLELGLVFPMLVVECLVEPVLVVGNLEAVQLVAIAGSVFVLELVGIDVQMGKS
jgi:hypothetical protein